MKKYHVICCLENGNRYSFYTKANSIQQAVNKVIMNKISKYENIIEPLIEIKEIVIYQVIRRGDK